MILVFGSHGKTGRLLMDMLDGARGFVGDVLDAPAVDAAMEGASAVVSLIGPTRGDRPCAKGTANILASMKKHGVRRFVCVTGAMIGHDKLGLAYRLISSQVPDEHMEDRREQERIVKESGLDWTLVRPTRLTDGEESKSLRAGDDFTVHAFDHVPRANVARFIANALFERQTIGKAYTLTI